MCGIIGFTGRLEAQKILTEGLAALEYVDTTVQVLLILRIQARFLFAKPSGKVKDLLAICDDENNSTCGIGHTR